MSAKSMKKEHAERMKHRRKWQIERTYSVGLRDGRIATTPPPIRANLSRNHPDYGLTPQQHFARKTARLPQAALDALGGG